MKTTIELPDDILREAKVKAARRGITLRKFFTEAVAEKIAREPLPPDHPLRKKEWPVPPPEGVTSKEIWRIQADIDEWGERIDSDGE